MATSDEANKKESAVGAPEMQGKHHSGMMLALAEELGCAVDDIYDFELCVARRASW